MATDHNARTRKPGCGNRRLLYCSARAACTGTAEDSSPVAAPSRRHAVSTFALAALFAAVAVSLPQRASADSHPLAAPLQSTADVELANPRWTSLEQWAWAELSAGRQVNLPGPCPDWWFADGPSGQSPDSAAYMLSGAFLTQVMTEPAFRARTAEVPVVINGARIAGDVLVHGGKNEHPVTITCSVIEGNLHFHDREVDGAVNLFRVRTTGRVEFSDVRVSSSVGLLRSDVGSIKVIGSQIDGSLALRGTRVHGATQVYTTVVGRGLRLECRRAIDDPGMEGCRSRYGAVDFKSVRVGGLVEIGKADFFGRVTLQSVHVGLSFVARSATYHDHFSILDGVFDQRLQMVENVASVSVFMEGVRVGSSLSLRNGRYGNVALRGADVGGNLDFRDSEFEHLDLTGTVAGGELRVAAGDEAIRWGSSRPGPHFVLKNTRVRALQDSQAAWPPSVELDGFEYEKLGGLEFASAEVPYLRGVDWFRQWLARDETYSPHPYRHLSAVLRTQGQSRVADAILYEAKERERIAIPHWQLERIWLEVLRYVVGYGIGFNELRAIYWMAAFMIIGWIVGMCASRRRRIHPLSLLWYSLSYTVPGLTVSRQDNVPMPLCARSWFYVQRIFCYAFALLAAAAVVGIVQP